MSESKKKVEELEAKIQQMERDMRIYELLLAEKERTIQSLMKALEIISGTTEANKMSAVMSLSQLARGGDDGGSSDSGENKE